MRNKFDMQLENLSAQLINMGSLCEKANCKCGKSNSKRRLRACETCNERRRRN